MIHCEICMEEGDPVAFQAEFVRPVQSDEIIRDMLFLRLERVSTAGPVTTVSIQAAISPLPVSRQRDLFHSTDHIRPQEELATLVNRLSNRLGNQAVLHAELTADPRPEFHARLTPVFSHHTGNFNDRLAELVTSDCGADNSHQQLDRPVSLLAEPLLLHEPEDSLVGYELRYDGRVSLIAKMTGPERLQTCWWEEVPIQRDYFKVETSDGAHYWLFQDIKTRQWFLHGIFD